MARSDPARIAAIVVAYQPDPERLGLVVGAISAQVERVILVENGGGCRVEFGGRVGNVEAIRNAENVGLAAALNQGIARAIAAGFEWVVLLDQDSVVGAGMVDALMLAFESHPEGSSIAALGPVHIDARSGFVAPFVTIGFPFSRKCRAASGDVVECDFLITSGSLIPVAALARIGKMDERLFIDNVDLEWSFRARRLGFRLLGVGSATMSHEIGDHVRRLPFGAGEFQVHAPTRLYYMMRNRLLLYRRPETPVLWIAQDLPRLVLKLAGFSFFVAPRWRNLVAMVRGLVDGLRGRSGAAPDLI